MTLPPRHYPTSRARCADLVVHIVGLAFSLFGGGVLLGLSVAKGSLGLVLAVCVYAVGMLAILGALGKLFLPGVGRRFWIVLYVALSWLVVIAFKPMIALPGSPSCSSP